MNKKNHVYNPLVESRDTNDDVMYFIKEQYIESSFQFMCHAYNSRTRSKDVWGDYMATRLVHAWPKKKFLQWDKKLNPSKQNIYTNGSTNKLFTTNLMVTPPIANPYLVPITTTKVPTTSKLFRKEFQTIQIHLDT